MALVHLFTFFPFPKNDMSWHVGYLYVLKNNGGIFVINVSPDLTQAGWRSATLCCRLSQLAPLLESPEPRGEQFFYFTFLDCLSSSADELLMLIGI